VRYGVEVAFPYDTALTHGSSATPSVPPGLCCCVGRPKGTAPAEGKVELVGRLAHSGCRCVDHGAGHGVGLLV